MRKLMIAFMLVTLAGSVTIGAAATHSVSVDDLGSGSAPVQSCDVDGVTIDYIISLDDPPTLETVVVSDVDARCLGQTMALWLEGAPGSVLWSTELVVYSTEMAIPIVGADGLPTPVSPLALASVTITISGSVALS